MRTFRPAVLTNDGAMLVMLGHEKNRDYLYVFQSQTGVLSHKFIPRYQGAKKDQAGQLIPVPGKATQVALMDQDKGKGILDVNVIVFSTLLLKIQRCCI